MRSIVFGVLLFFSATLMAQEMDSLKKVGVNKMNGGDFAGAIEVFQNAIKLDTSVTGNSLIYSYVGIAAKEIENMALAKEMLTKSIERGIEETIVFDMLANICKSDKDYACQEMVYTKGMERFPDQKSSYARSLAYTYYNTKNYAKLVPACKAALLADSKDEKMLQFIAVGFQRLNKTDSAKVYNERLLAVNDKDLNGNVFMGNYLYQLGKDKLDAAKNTYEKIKTPDRVQYSAFQKNMDAIMLEYYAPAATYLEKAYTLKKMDGIKTMLYAIYIKMGNKEKAELYK